MPDKRNGRIRLVRILPPCGVLCVALLLTACTPSDVATIDVALDRMQGRLAADYEALVDDAGLIINPTRTRVEPLDVYGSALLIEARAQSGDPLDGVHLGELARRDVDDYRAATRAPEQWTATSLAILSRSTGDGLPFEIDPLELPTADDPVDESVSVWSLALLAGTDDEADREALRRRTAALAAAGEGGAVAAWRTLEACALLEQTCHWRGRLRIEPDLESIGGILEMRAAAELAAVGVAVDGWRPGSVAAEVERTLRDLRDGEDLLAANLARILHLAGADGAEFAAYLDRASARVDGRTGLYRVEVHDQGTISGTYEAMRTVGDHFVRLVEGRPTAAFLTELLLDDTDLPGVERARALAVLTTLGPLRDDLREQLASLRDTYAGTPVTQENAAEMVAVLDALRFVEADPGGITVVPWPLTPENERSVDALLAMAQEDAFDNSAEVLDHYSEHLDGLVASTVSLPDDSPLFLPRLSLIANQPPDELTADEVTVLRERLAARRGCQASPLMYRTSTDPDSPCELGLTRRAVQSGFGL